MKMNNKVYGIVGIKSIMSNWNADFTGRPKTISTTQIFGSDKAFKYPMKKMWNDEGEHVLFIKSHKLENIKGTEKLQPLMLEERYNKIFNTQISDKTPSKEILKNLFSAIDVMNFGATFAIKKQNISITGAVQVGQGFNKYDETNIETQDILSPFRNSGKEDAEQSTLGTKIVSDECHYMYPFSVNPQNYNDYIEILEDFEGYTKEAYNKFKEACLISATALNTNSKAGCENEFAIFIVAKENTDLYLANLDQYIDFIKNENEKDIVDLSSLRDVLEVVKDKIEKIEIYYNKVTLEVNENGLACEKHDIFDGLK